MLVVGNTRMGPEYRAGLVQEADYTLGTPERHGAARAGPLAPSCGHRMNCRSRAPACITCLCTKEDPRQGGCCRIWENTVNITGCVS